MPNNLSSNVMTKVMKSIAAGFESNRVSTKTVNTENIKGEHTSSTGDTIYRKRKTSYRAAETSSGDVSGGGADNDILVGRIPYVKQDVITVKAQWDSVEEALELNQLDELLAPMGEELVTRVERNFNDYMIQNSGLTFGTPGTAVDAWTDVAYVEAMMNEIGVPSQGEKYYQMNSFTGAALASATTAINQEGLVKTAFEQAQVPSPLAGLIPLKSNALRSFTSGDASGDREGALNGAPDVTWASAKDTMQQTITVDGFGANTTIKAGETIRITGKYHANPRNQNVLIDETGARVEWCWTVVSDATLDGSGAGTITVTNAAIFDAASNNQYDNISAAPADNDVITILGSDSTLYKPNLAYHKDAFSFATIQLPKLYATDLSYKSADGLTFRVSRYSDGSANQQLLRVDLVPAFGVSNPLHSVRCFGK
tara:strand:- start:4417 stop:5694 length:1278 start_codon:yes stop_codon:yes gene_type:complete